MPPFRNPFGKRLPADNGLTPSQDENTAPSERNRQTLGSQNGDLSASGKSSALSIRPGKEQTNEYKLSVYDSGVYLPPSPPEKKSFWHRSPTSAASSNHRSMLSENEPFNISRESFDSYRRSFDISARSPIVQPETNPSRQSLDSRNSRPPRTGINGSTRPEQPSPTDEENFEDIGLNDDVKPKKKGIFSRFADSSEPPTTDENIRPGSSHRGFHLPGRKRGASGQGAELRPVDKTAATVSDDRVIR